MKTGIPGIIVIAVLVANAIDATAQWTENGTNLFPENYATVNVGIGTSSPAEKLHINGSIRGNASGGAIRINTTSGYVDIGPMNTSWSHFQTNLPKFYFNKPVHIDGALSSYNTQNLDLQTNGITRMTILNSGGNVGIGTTSPEYKLDVLGPENNWKARFGGADGYITIGPANQTWAHIYTDRPNFIFNQNIWSITGGFSSYQSANLTLQTNGSTRMTISNATGNVGIGTTDPGSFKLAVEGKVGAREVVVTVDNWYDHVFEPSYNLPTLSELEQYIKTNKHLPEVPTANEVKENGLSLGEMNAILLKKVEELTLHLIEMDKRMQTMEEENRAQKNEINKLKKK